jgi:hypothetical protein
MNNLKQDPKYRNGYKDKARLAAIHNLPCSLSYLKGWKQTTITEAHHLHGGGMGKKSSDLLTMSLAREHHTSGKNAFHKIGRVAFEELHNCTQEDLIEITNKLLEYIK